ESSPTGMNTFATIAAATGATYTGTQTAATDYRAVVTCTNTGDVDVSTVASVAMLPFYSCYCTATNAGTTQITNVTIAGTTFNNSSGASPAPAYYTSYPPVGGATATLMQGATYTINATFDASAVSSVWIDYDHD